MSYLHIFYSSNWIYVQYAMLTSVVTVSPTWNSSVISCHHIMSLLSCTKCPSIMNKYIKLYAARLLWLYICNIVHLNIISHNIQFAELINHNKVSYCSTDLGWRFLCSLLWNQFDISYKLSAWVGLDTVQLDMVHRRHSCSTSPRRSQLQTIVTQQMKMKWTLHTKKNKSVKIQWNLTIKSPWRLGFNALNGDVS